MLFCMKGTGVEEVIFLNSPRGGVKKKLKDNTPAPPPQLSVIFSVSQCVLSHIYDSRMFTPRPQNICLYPPTPQPPQFQIPRNNPGWKEPVRLYVIQ